MLLRDARRLWSVTDSEQDDGHTHLKHRRHKERQPKPLVTKTHSNAEAKRQERAGNDGANASHERYAHVNQARMLLVLAIDASHGSNDAHNGGIVTDVDPVQRERKHEEGARWRRANAKAPDYERKDTEPRDPDVLAQGSISFHEEPCRDWYSHKHHEDADDGGSGVNQGDLYDC